MMDSGYFRFGVFQVDIQRAELWKDASRIKLQDKPFQLLVLLLERAGKTASRDELGRELWPENIDTNCDASLKTAVSKLRRALGDSASRPTFIRTVHLQGYRFVAPILKLDARDIPLNNSQVSRLHPSNDSRHATDDAIGIWRLLRSVRLLAVLLAVVMILAVVYAFRRNTVRVSRPNAQPAGLFVLPSDSSSTEPRRVHFDDVFGGENIAFPIMTILRKPVSLSILLACRKYFSPPSDIVRNSVLEV